jgi:hypothetical protein
MLKQLRPLSHLFAGMPLLSRMSKIETSVSRMAILLFLFFTCDSHGLTASNTPFYLVKGEILLVNSAQPVPDACDNVTNGGLIQGNESGCPNPTWDPGLISNVALPTGGSGTLQYLWIFTTGDPSMPVSQWNPIPNSNSPSYDPGPVAVTTHFRRCARRSGCLEFVAESNIVTKAADCCSNITQGGLIGPDQSACNAFDPDTLQNLQLPTGGSGVIEYQWVSSLTGTAWSSTNPDWTAIPGANEEFYDPAPITQTNFFIRLSRRDNCADFTGVSNIVTLAVNPPISVSGNISPPLCTGVGNGSIQLSLQGGQGPYQYNWSGGLGNSGSQSGLPAGSFNVTVTDANGCSAQVSFSLSNEIALSPSLAVGNESCAGAGNGSLNVNGVAGGTPPFAYNWSNNPGYAQPSQHNLVPGNYSITVSDASGCLAVASAVIEPGPALQAFVTTSAPSCAGLSDGSAIIDSIIGGSGQYAITWDDPAGQTGLTAINLSPGIYTASILDLLLGCSAQVQAVVPLGGTVLNLSVSVGDASCWNTADGNATVAASGGVPPYNYLWDASAMSQTSLTAAALSFGTYQVTVTDAAGCSATASAVVEAPLSSGVQLDVVPVTCAGLNNGSATAVVPNAGTLIYHYQWSGLPDTSSQVQQLAQGSYTVTVSVAGACSASATGVVTEPAALNLVLTATNATCSNSFDGSIFAQVSGGTPSPGYAFAWSNGSSAPDKLNGLGGGHYSVTIADVNNCTISGGITVLAPSPLTITLSTQDVSCAGQNTGSVSALASGGTAPYSYFWEDLNISSPQLIGLAAGAYTVEVTDANGCTNSATAFIFMPPPLELVINPGNLICDYDANGSAQGSASGGVPPYAYFWSTGQTASIIGGLSPGVYGLTITDDNGCTLGGSTVLTALSNLEIALSAQDESCFGAQDGAVNASSTGGAAPVTYAWSNGQSGASISGLSAGTYQVTATDAVGCIATGQAIVTSPVPLNCQITVIHPVSIHNESDGAVMVTANNIQNLDISWSNGSSQQVLWGLSPGTYIVTVTDPGSCGCIDTVVLTNPSRLGDFVWHDIYSNNIQDAWEPGMEGLQLWLTGTTVSGISVDTFTFTDAAGHYHFDGLEAGSYQLEIELPNLHLLSNPQSGSNPNIDSDFNQGTSLSQVIFLPQGVNRSDLDAGFQILDSIVTIGDRVWLDLNQNGLQDLNEPGLPNIAVKLYQQPGSALVASTTTNNQGVYLFTNVYPGTYFLEFSLQGLSSTHVFSPQNVGTNDNIDSDVNPANGRSPVFVVMNLMQDNLMLDAGIYDLCNNVTSGGTIGYEESLCGAGPDPAAMVSLSLPSGGFGNLEYYWMVGSIPVFNGPGTPGWVPIPNTNAPAYNPGPIFQTSYFIRLSRRQGCPQYVGASNVVQKKVVPFPVTQIIEEPVEVCLSDPGNFEAAFAGTNATYFWNFGTDAFPPTANTRVTDDIFWTSPGIKLVSLTVSNAGCSKTVSTIVMVDECSNNLGTSPGDLVMVYPNPAVEQITVEKLSGDAARLNLKLYDANGRSRDVYLMPSTARKMELMLPGEKDEVLFLHVESEAGGHQVIKIARSRH